MTCSATQRVAALVSGTPVWPVRDGGDSRIAGLACALSKHYRVHVVRPHCTGAASPPSPIITHEYTPNPADGSLAYVVYALPRVGLSVIGGRSAGEVRSMLRRIEPDVTYFAHSYLAAVVGEAPGVIVTDFPNIESHRFASLARIARGRHRASAVIESVKARRWERRVAGEASVCLAVSVDDAQVISSWGGSALVVPNAAVRPRDVKPSPSEGPAVFVASATYAPNRDGAEHLVRDIWPTVLARRPEAQLRIVGRGTRELLGHLAAFPGVTVLGEVDEVTPYLENAALVVAPVRSGGGTQLKVLEALAHARVVVGTPYGGSSLPARLSVGYVAGATAADIATRITDLLDDVNARHRLEAKLTAAGAYEWDEAADALIRSLPRAPR